LYRAVSRPPPANAKVSRLEKKKSAVVYVVPDTTYKVASLSFFFAPVELN
jgi:hypothetical protein